MTDFSCCLYDMSKEEWKYIDRGQFVFDQNLYNTCALLL